MKTRNFVLLMTVAYLTGFSQEKETPAEISPLIGDTLDAVEREHYRLLPNIEGFQSAVFFANADSSLRVKVMFDRGGMRLDTVIQRYRTVRSLRDHLAKLGEVPEEKRIAAEPAAYRSPHVPLGAGWHVRLENDSMISNVVPDTLVGDSLYFYSETTEPEYVLATLKVPVGSIVEIQRVKKSQVLSGALIGGGCGVGLALFFAIIKTAQALSAFSEPIRVEPGGGSGGGKPSLLVVSATLVGAGVVVGGAMGAVAGVDEVHDFSKLTDAQKRFVIQQIVRRP